MEFTVPLDNRAAHSISSAFDAEDAGSREARKREPQEGRGGLCLVAAAVVVYVVHDEKAVGAGSTVVGANDGVKVKVRVVDS